MPVQGTQIPFWSFLKKSLFPARRGSCSVFSCFCTPGFGGGGPLRFGGGGGGGPCVGVWWGGGEGAAWGGPFLSMFFHLQHVFVLFAGRWGYRVSGITV